MASEFITRVEHEKDEPYTVIFRTDDADKYKHIEDECRRMIGHEKPTVDAVPVVRCKECKHYCGEETYTNHRICKMWNEEVFANGYCYYGERKDGEHE